MKLKLKLKFACPRVLWIYFSTKKKINLNLYRVTHKGCDFSDDQKRLKTIEFEGISRSLPYVWPFLKFVNNIVNVNTVTELLHCPSFVKPRPDNISSLQSSLKSHPLWVTLYIWSISTERAERESKTVNLKPADC